MLSIELGKVVAFFDSSLSMGSNSLLLCQHSGGSLSVDVGGSSSVSMGKELVLGGGINFFSEVVGRMGQLEGRPLAPLKAERVPLRSVPLGHARIKFLARTAASVLLG